MGKLIVTVVGCRGIKTNDWTGTGDPYVKVRCAGREYQTSVKTGANPVWEEKFAFMIADPNTERVGLYVFDKDTVGVDDFIGQYELGLGGLQRGVDHENWFILHHCKQGEIGVRVLAEDFGDLPGGGYQAPPPVQAQAPCGFQPPPVYSGYQQQVSVTVTPNNPYPPFHQQAPPPPPYQPLPPPPPPAAPVVNVIHAAYGGRDVTYTVQHMNGGINIAPFAYSSVLCGCDPFPNVKKDLVIVSTQGPAVHVYTSGESTPTNITGPYQNSARLAPPHGSEIVHANYGGKDVTRQCQAIFNQRGGLFLDRSMNEHFGDAMPNVQKALVVTYLTIDTDGIPRRQVAYWIEGESVQLPRA